MSSSQDKSQELLGRMMDFAVKIIQLTKSLPETKENGVIINQILRSSTSIGANYAEANDAASRQDFRNKVFIAKKEAGETRYWLDLMKRVNPEVDTLSIRDENSQLIMILQKIISTLKNGS
jgi:four helix bundle protein